MQIIVEYTPALTLTIAGLVVLLVVLRKFDGENLIAVLDKANFVLVAGGFLFVVVGIIFLFKSPDWTADLLKVLAGVIVGASSAGRAGRPSKPGTPGSNVDIEGSTLSNSRVAGRDINETIEEMYGEVSEIRDSVVNQYSQISRSIDGLESSAGRVVEYLFHTAFLTEGEPVNETARIARVLQPSGWTLFSAMPSYMDREGLVLIFRRFREPGQHDQVVPGGDTYTVRFYHGLNEIELEY